MEKFSELHRKHEEESKNIEIAVKECEEKVSKCGLDIFLLGVPQLAGLAGKENRFFENKNLINCARVTDSKEISQNATKRLTI